MKDHLTTREVDFISINIQTEEDAFDQLRELGMMALPVVARGDEYTLGLDLQQVLDFLGLDEAAPELLPADALVDRIAAIVPATVRYAAQLPSETHDRTIPGRDRTYLGLANHVVGHVENFLNLAGGANFTLDGIDPDILKGLERRIDSPAALAERADGVLADLWTRFHGAKPSDLDRLVETFFGDQTLYALLGSCAYSVAQHARQLIAVLELLGVEPDRPLGDDDYAGIPLPAALWE